MTNLTSRDQCSGPTPVALPCYLEIGQPEARCGTVEGEVSNYSLEELDAPAGKVRDLFEELAQLKRREADLTKELKAVRHKIESISGDLGPWIELMQDFSQVVVDESPDGPKVAPTTQRKKKGPRRTPLTRRIVDVLSTQPGRPFTTAEIVEQLGERPTSLSSTLTYLKDRNRIIRVDDIGWKVDAK